MVNRFCFRILPLVIAPFVCYSFFVDQSETIRNHGNPVLMFSLSTPSEKKGISEHFEYVHAIHLDSTCISLDNLQQIFTTPNHIVAFDGRTDSIERLCFFDKKTGLLSKEVHFIKDNFGELSSIRGVGYSPKEQCFYALAAGRQSILKYTESGDFVSEVFIGMYGSKMEVLEDGNFLVETTMNEEVCGGFYRLILFDKEGNILKRFFPYKSQPDQFLMNSFGIFSKIGETIHYSWPLGDTIYAYNKGVFTPELIADFGSEPLATTDQLDSDLSIDNIFSKNSFLLTDFAIANDLFVFSYINANSQKTMAFINKQTGSYFNTRDAIPDEMSEIFLGSDILGLDGDTVIIQITKNHAKRIMNNNSREAEMMKKKSPDMYQAISEASQNKNPTLFHLKVKK